MNGQTYYYYHYVRSFDAALLYDSVAALNILYGGLNPGVTNVIYTNGEMDMWFPRGMKDVGNNSAAYVINIPCMNELYDLN